MFTLLVLPFSGRGMMGRDDWGVDGGQYPIIFYAFHMVMGVLVLTLLCLAVVFLWKKIEMMDHDKEHHHNHK